MKKIIDCYVVLSVRDFEPKILIKGVHLTTFENNCLIESRFFTYEEKVYVLLI